MRFFTPIEYNYKRLMEVEMLALELLFRETRKCRTREEYELHRLAELQLGKKYKQIMQKDENEAIQPRTMAYLHKLWNRVRFKTINHMSNMQHESE